MSFQISSTVTVNDSRKAIVTQLNPGTSVPSSPTAGDIYFDNSLKALRLYNGSTWLVV
jgi:hypothetical protein